MQARSGSGTVAGGAPERHAYVALLFVIAVLLGLTLALGEISLRGFADVERETAVSEIGRVRDALADRVQALQVTDTDYGAWDDMYAFMASHDAKWAKNVAPETLIGLGLDVAVALQPDGTAALQVTVPGVDPSVVAPLISELGHAGFVPGGGARAGIVALNGRLWMVAGAPILRSDRSGPARGGIVFAYAFDGPRQADFARTVGLPFSVAPGADASAVDTILPQKETLLASGNFMDLTRRHPVRVAVTVPARHSALARRVVAQLLGALVVGCLIFTLLARRMRMHLAATSASQHTSEEVRRSVVGAASDAVGVIEISTMHVVDANPAFRSLLTRGQAGDEESLTDIDCEPSISTVFRELKLAGEVNTEVRITTAGGESRALDIVGVMVEGPGGATASIVARDITARREAEERARHFAFHDVLTGLPNRHLFQDRLDELLARRTPPDRAVGVLFLDLDAFKQVNDRLGHDAADQVLCAVGERLAASLTPDDMVARHGGDEFLILIPDVACGASLERIAERIADGLRAPFAAGDDEIGLRASIGGCLAPADGKDARTLVRNADIAMYQAKGLGRGGYRAYDPESHRRFSHLAGVRSGLSRALRDREFVVHYQPQVLVRTGQIIGVEALIRWQPPGSRMVSPADFIPEAEASGLIVEIGEWVLREACAQAEGWRRAGLGDVRMAVNVSPRQLAFNGFVDTVMDALTMSGLDPELLELEITESAAMEDPERGRAILERLRSYGVAVALDDFGTGHSSLSMLDKMPFDRLKIDQSFLSEGQNTDRRITRAILALGRSLDLEIIAEGVETAEQLAFLRAHRCTIAQGYGFARPMLASGVEALLRGGGILTMAPVVSLARKGA